ncbi:gap junction beta-2 protein-like isoform X2 [Ciona intestinalis]
MSWALLEKLLGEVATHSTLIGKYWFSFLFVFRVIVVLSVGDKVYSDEQSKFVCNTLQPGCDNICFNQFSPISHIRFWAMQDVATEPMERDPDVNPTLRHRYSDAPPNYNSTPTKNENEIVSKSKKSRSSNRRSEAIYNNELPGYNKGLPVAEVVPVQTVIPKVDMKQIKDPPILAAYVLHIYFRMAIEASFIALQYILFQFYVPEMYRCEGYPCPQRVECFISRPMEKNVFLIFMYVISGVCLVMDFMEVNYFGFRKCVHLIRGKKSGTYLREFEARWHTDPVLAGRFNPTRGGYGLRRHRDLSITDGSGDEYRSVETSDDGSGFE